MDRLDRQLLDLFQRDFPLTPEPYGTVAERLGVDQATVLSRPGRLSEQGVIGRIGATVGTGAIGASTLAAMTVPAERLDEVAAMVSAYDEVNHNYEREHAFNLWFVVTAEDRNRIDTVLAEIRTRTGLDVMDLPMLERFRIDLGFPLQWT